MIIRNYITAGIKFRDITQRKLQNRVDIDKKRYLSIVKDYKEPYVKEAYQIAKLLDISIENLFELQVYEVRVPKEIKMKLKQVNLDKETLRALPFHTPQYTGLSNKLKLLMKIYMISSKELASMMNVGTKVISSYVNGYKPLYISKAHMLSKIFGFSIEDVFDVMETTKEKEEDDIPF